MFYSAYLVAFSIVLPVAAVTASGQYDSFALDAPAHSHQRVQKTRPAAAGMMRTERVADYSPRATPVQRQSKRRHGKSKSLLETHSGQSSSLFPLYALNPDYKHPLDAAGQDQEKAAVAQLTSSDVMDKLKKLLDFPTRSYTNSEESVKVEHFLKDNFENLGFTSCLHDFQNPETSSSMTNVLAHVPGTTAETVVIGAHYDSRPFDGSAPGADDNGSGVAALMAIAKAFADTKVKPKASIYFVAFAGEEPGLMGSAAFASALVKGGEGIPAECKAAPTEMMANAWSLDVAQTHKAIIMDEIGWKSTNLDQLTVNLESYDWTKDVMDHLRESSQTHNGDALRVVHSNNPFGSDHMSFLDNKMQAVLTINGDDEQYPNYHKSSDTIDKVNGDLLSMIAKMNMGALMRLAGTQST